ncbi:hypothetical protein GCM10020367_68430 [Streptomyces sannanensis]|uniref:Uncharacterized protein n=1 Tax=Streptomyces sannanensis TaxID=285536 RepID=A0ABP6SND8_9ACTN
MGVTQDADYYLDVSILPRAMEAGMWIAVRLSNYGNLAVVTTPRPDGNAGPDQAVADGALSERDRRQWCQLVVGQDRSSAAIFAAVQAGQIARARAFG